MQTCPLQTISSYKLRIHSLFLKLNRYRGVISRSCPLQKIPCLAWNPLTSYKRALKKSECRHVPFRRNKGSSGIHSCSAYMRSTHADMSPSDDPLFRWNPSSLVCIIALLYERAIKCSDMDSSETEGSLKGISLESLHFF